MTAREIALFPLKTVLFPGGPLPLRIFEPRYLAMVGRCLRENDGFGVVLIREGSEVGSVETYSIGTVAQIVDWYQGSDGLLGVTARGGTRFKLEATHRQSDGLYMGTVSLLEPEPSTPLPEECQSMARLLAEVLDDLGSHYRSLPRAYDDAVWVGHRLAEILPLPLATKQSMLELDDPLERLSQLRPELKP